VFLRRFWWLPGVVVLVILALGPILAGRLVPPITALSISLAATTLGLAWGLGAAALGLWARRRAWARALFASAALPLVTALGVAAAAFAPADSASRFNDVSTDLADPPAFHSGPAAQVPFSEAARAAQPAAYGDLAPLHFRVSPQIAFDAALAVAAGMPGWRIVSESRSQGTIQAVARTVLFRFEDDVAIRVRPGEGRTIVDIRSRSRIGEGDRGANAARIRAYRAALIARLATL